MVTNKSARTFARLFVECEDALADLFAVKNRPSTEPGPGGARVDVLITKLCAYRQELAGLVKTEL